MHSLADVWAQYLASEIFPALPEDLRTLSYSAFQNDSKLATKYSLPLSRTTTEALLDYMPPSVLDSLSTYLTIEPSNFLTKPLESYISTTTSPPPIYSSTKTSSCELCLRSWIPLTYHHLIPRSVHAKALKRGWCEEWELNKVAWLCRSCHSMVHRVASNEELAREWDSVEKLLTREDVTAFVGWVGRVRWNSR
jgi:5-methylcytosine-specific restriction endonuclease McrA